MKKNVEDDFSEVNITIDELVEKKFRDTKLESQTIAFALRRDFNIIFSFSKECFTIEPYQKMYEILQQNRMTFPRDILWNFLKKQITDEQRDLYKSFVRRIYDEDISDVNRKNIDSLIIKLNELHESRGLMKTVGEIVENIKSFNLKKARKKLQRVIYSDSSLSKVQRGDFLEDYEERKKFIIQRRENPHLFSGVPTGIRQFDELSGGLQRGEFGVIIAATGLGKSVALGNFALNAWMRDYNVLFVSLEMSKHQLEFRMDSRMTKIIHSKFRKGDLSEDDFHIWQRRVEKLREKRKNFLETVCLHRGCCSIEVEEEAMKIQSRRGEKVDLIIIDYLNLMSPNDHRGDKREWKGQAEVAWDIKGLCMDFNDVGVPIWTANQLTDEGQKAKKLETYHLKYSRAISEVAPVIVAMNQSIDDALQDIMKMWILKCRDFPSFKRPILLHPQFNIMALNSEIVAPFGNRPKPNNEEKKS